MRCKANCESVYRTELTAGWMLLDTFVSTLGESKLSVFVTTVTGLTSRILSDRPEEMLAFALSNISFLRVPWWCYIWKRKYENQSIYMQPGSKLGQKNLLNHFCTTLQQQPSLALIQNWIYSFFLYRNEYKVPQVFQKQHIHFYSPFDQQGD